MDHIHICKKWLVIIRRVTNSTNNTTPNTVEYSNSFLSLRSFRFSVHFFFSFFFSSIFFSNVDSVFSFRLCVCVCVFINDLTGIFHPLFSKCAPISCFVINVFVRVCVCLSESASKDIGIFKNSFEYLLFLVSYTSKKFSFFSLLLSPFQNVRSCVNHDGQRIRCIFVYVKITDRMKIKMFINDNLRFLLHRDLPKRKSRCLIRKNLTLRN